MLAWIDKFLILNVAKATVIGGSKPQVLAVCTYKHLHKYLHACIPMYRCRCMHADALIKMYRCRCMHEKMHACRFIDVHVCMYVCAHHMHMHTCTYKHTLMHIESILEHPCVWHAVLQRLMCFLGTTRMPLLEWNRPCYP
jgi:hypothetical protein